MEILTSIWSVQHPNTGQNIQQVMNNIISLNSGNFQQTHFVKSYFRTANLMNGFQMNGRVVDPQKQSVIVELLLMKKTQARLQQKCVSTCSELWANMPFGRLK